MRVTAFHLLTLKETPADAEVASHKLMIRAGLIHKVAAGIYTWTPLGLRVLRKVEAIIREEMQRAGALELLMPAVQPAELWRQSGRWDAYGPELARLQDRHERSFVLAPTHEEVITEFVRKEVRSYRQLPKHFFQIQMKFRDEIRPRFGVMRAREFVMKDSYSFHASYEDLVREYEKMYATYSRIFKRLGLQFRAVAADTGSIGGSVSHEFHVIAETGEDLIAYCPDSSYAANVELAEALAPSHARAAPEEPLRKVATPGVASIADLVAFLQVPVERTVKSLVVLGSDDEPVLLLLRGDHELNEIKAGKIEGLRSPLTFAGEDLIRRAFGAGPGSLGPVGFQGRIIADRSVAVMSDFITGANEDGAHYLGVNIGRDFPEPEVADLRRVVEGDPSPDGAGTLKLCRGIEVGHIFQLRTKYSEAMQCTFLDETGKERYIEMGCYGIGVSRIVGAAIEQNHDEKGIIWPIPIAPFEVVLCPIGAEKSAAVRSATETLYDQLQKAGVEVIWDDRNERAGVMFADWELIGVPWRVVISERGLAAGEVELSERRTLRTERLPWNQAAEAIAAAVTDARAACF